MVPLNQFATRQVIFLLNCCHVLTVTNILVLAAYVGGRLAHSPAWQGRYSVVVRFTLVT